MLKLQRPAKTSRTSSKPPSTDREERREQQGHSSFAVGGFTGMSEEMVEHVHGHHDPDFQRTIAEGIGSRKRA